MSRVAAIVGICLLAASASALRDSSYKRGFLTAKLQPDVIARTLVGVEDQWKAQVTAFASCSGKTIAGAAECRTAKSSFEKSCATVTKAVIQASNGDHDVVREYMDDVCDASALAGWREKRCRNFGAFVEGAMSDNNYANREDLDVSQVCNRFFTSFVADEHARITQETIEQDKKAAEEKAKADEVAAKVAAEVKKQLEERAEKAKAAAEEAAKAAAEEATKATKATATAEPAAVEAPVTNGTATEPAAEAPAQVAPAAANATAATELKVAEAEPVPPENSTATAAAEEAPAAPATPEAVAVVAAPQNATETSVAAVQNVTATEPAVVEEPKAKEEEEAPVNTTASAAEAPVTDATNATNATNATKSAI